MTDWAKKADQLARDLALERARSEVYERALKDISHGRYKLGDQGAQIMAQASLDAAKIVADQQVEEGNQDNILEGSVG